MEFNDKVPIYYQIKQYVYQQIITNKFPPGTKVPAVRQFALDLSVNVNTIQRALSDLIREGILVPQRGRGNFVTDNHEILNQLRQTLIHQQLEHLYDQLQNLQITPDEMITALTTYIKERKDNNHE